MAIALAGFVTTGALPAAATPSTIQYVALGDSYAAGTAAVGSLPNCPHGAGGYPVLLAQGRIVLTANAACSGATTDGVRSQLSALERDTRLVTLTVGAANLGLSFVLDACTVGTPQQCRDAISDAQGVLGDCREGDRSELDGPLKGLYGEVADEARGARIVVTGYPLLFKSPAAADPRAAINEATTRLNCVIERAVAATQDTYANIRYVDVTEEFAGHGIVDPRSCTASAFIHSLLICDPPPPSPGNTEAFHPTAAGYAAYAEAISAALPAGWLDRPST